ncbi:MAG: beta-lactamase family protein [Gemmatimonadetes bacterium]|nr:beta-lactamase family protein [Gemmatimonadota bacterium]
MRPLRLLAVLATLPLPLAAQPALDTPRARQLRPALPRVDSLLRAFAERARVPGIAYGVVVDGRLLHVAAAGVRDVPGARPVDTGSVFRIASMSKSFAAAAILQLRDAGQLRLDDPAERYVPELAGVRYPTSDAPKITVRHLLTHSAGFPEDNPWGDQQLSATDEALGAMLRAGIPFSTAPGTAYEYSNLGFAILGRIVRNVSGMPYARYLRTRITGPLGMTSTYLEARDVPPARLVKGYRLEDGRWREEPPLPDGAFGAMGGMLTSAADLSRWVAFLLDAFPARDGADSPVLSRASRREMQQLARFGSASAVRGADGAPVLTAGGYGYGLRVSATCLSGHVVAHSGGLPGFGSIMQWLPEAGVGIIAMGSLTYTSWGAPTAQALALLAETGGMAPRAPVPAPALLAAQAQVTTLVNDWRQPLADSVAAMNLFLDESAPRRASAIARLRDEVGGACRADGPIVAENALRGEWRLQCARGALRVAVTLAPTARPGVQFLSVRAMAPGETLEKPRACR